MNYRSCDGSGDHATAHCSPASSSVSPASSHSRQLLTFGLVLLCAATLINGIRKLALFGSAITGRFTDCSDIDILVDFRPQERVGFFRLADIEEALDRKSTRLNSSHLGISYAV